MGERELISSLAKVILDLKQTSDLISLCYQDQVHYNAYEKDIAIVNIFFGESTVFGQLQYCMFLIKLMICLFQNLKDLQR